MNKCKIFTEGKSDVKFLKDYCNEILSKDLDENDFDKLGSWSGYKAGGTIKPSLVENYIYNEKKNILIIDADNDYHARIKQVKNDFEQFGIPVEVFLFPNHSHNGNLETLLAEIAVNRKLMDCFLEYEKCVDNHPKPLNHSRIYAYMDMSLYPDYKNAEGKDLRQEEFRNYRNTAHWNLKHDYLNPLKAFLKNYLN